jgi:hypothetical protein
LEKLSSKCPAPKHRTDKFFYCPYGDGISYFVSTTTSTTTSTVVTVVAAAEAAKNEG